MFEGKPPIAAKAQTCATGAPVGAPARALQWSDLVAQLEAARELRAVLADSGEDSLASFDAALARRLAAQSGGDSDEDKRAVNLEDSVNLKGTGGIEIAGVLGAQCDAELATRGQK